ncbi:MAG: AAA family ATPase [Oscillospiraceae bacterium]
MIFYKFIGVCSDEYFKELQLKELRESGTYGPNEKYSSVNRAFYNSYRVEGAPLVALCAKDERNLYFVAACDPLKNDLKSCTDVVAKRFKELTFTGEEEITIEEYSREIERARSQEYIAHYSNSYRKELGIVIEPNAYNIFDGAPYAIDERIFDSKGVDKKQSLNRLSEIMASESFYEEIERIYSPENEKEFKGHPVHYLISAGDKAAAKDMIDVLIPALLYNKRLVGGRVCDVEKMTARAYRDENFPNIFSASQGNTVVFNLSIESSIGSQATGYYELMEYLSKKIGEFGNNTLFVFVDISGKRNVSDGALAAILAHSDVIHISEGYGDKKKTREYLKRLAEKTGYKDYKISDLEKFLPAEKAEYTVSDIYTAYNRWFGNGLKTHVYRAYREQDMAKIELKKKTSVPYKELQKLVGLSDVKRVTDEILAAARMNKLRKSMGLEYQNASMHMLFSGNPGTAKTTVARLLAEILKDEEVLKNGHIVECGRQDLVGRYVGWTAKTVEEKFRAARGGILFIDEAYSLVDEHNSYGTEAVNTIVQMMENYRDEVIVIFAGYPEKMKEFLDQNEGLRSRIAFHLNFPDYNSSELLEIMELMLDKKDYVLESEAVKSKCLEIFEKGSERENFGNGRFVRNVLEMAIMRQANRIFRDYAEKEITKEEASTLIPEDFEVLEVKSNTKSMGLVG